MAVVATSGSVTSAAGNDKRQQRGQLAGVLEPVGGGRHRYCGKARPGSTPHTKARVGKGAIALLVFWQGLPSPLYHPVS